MTKKIILPLLVIVLAACNISKNKELTQQNDSLVSVAIEQQKITNDLVSTLIAIDKNLQEIKEKEKLIGVNMGSPEANSPDIQKTINKDIQDIYSLMLANKETIANLEQQLKSSGSENKGLNNLLAGLNRQLKDKSVEIIALNERLANQNIEISTLNFTMEGMGYVIDSIRTANKNTRALLDSTTIELYTAFYSFGTKKELKEHKIISNEGVPLFGKTKVLTSNFNEDYFTRIDIREVDEIPLFRPKVKILTSHPEGSYKIVSGEEDTKTINILDKDAFWSVSNFLVVQVN